MYYWKSNNYLILTSFIFISNEYNYDVNNNENNINNDNDNNNNREDISHYIIEIEEERNNDAINNRNTNISSDNDSKKSNERNYKIYYQNIADTETLKIGEQTLKRAIQ